MKKLKIRRAIPEDVPLLIEFIRELAKYEKLSHEVKVTEELLLSNLFGDRQVAEAIIGEADGKPVAFALYFHNFSTFLGKPGLYLEDLFVRPEYRSHGYGLEMLQYMANIALERGCGRFEWWVLDWNKPAIGFYEKIGARPMNDWTVFRLDGQNLTNLASKNRIAMH